MYNDTYMSLKLLTRKEVCLCINIKGRHLHIHIHMYIYKHMYEHLLTT
jgi:hypothetical protein